MIKITPTSFMFRNENLYSDIVNAYVKYNISSIRVNWTRFTDEEYYWQIYQYRKAFNLKHIEPIIMLDIPSPGKKYRLFFNGPGKYEVEKGKEYEIIYGNNLKTDITTIMVDAQGFCTKINVGDICIVGDGEVAFEVITKESQNGIKVRAVNTGAFSLGKSISSLKAPYIKDSLDKDIERYGEIINKIHPESLILSFCEETDEIERFKNIDRSIDIIPKIETKRGVENLENMMNVCRKVFLGRGDLGVMNPYEFGQLQDSVIQKTKYSGKELIVATGILESINQGTFVPTRAELTEVYYLLQKEVCHFVTSSAIGRNIEYLDRFYKIFNNTLSLN